jgi:Parkin co-regulated protein
MFRRLFLRGDLPCHQKTHKDQDPERKLNLAWKIRPEDLDYAYYLPIFFDGFVHCHSYHKKNFFLTLFLPLNIYSLREADFPYNFLARYAVHDMLSSAGNKVRQVIPQLVIPIKCALNTRNSEIIVSTLRIIQHLCICGQ